MYIFSLLSYRVHFLSLLAFRLSLIDGSFFSLFKSLLNLCIHINKVKDPATGHLVTSFPNDMMRVLREQLDLAFLRLRPHRFILVLNPAAVALRSNQLQFDDVVASALNAISKREVMRCVCVPLQYNSYVLLLFCFLDSPCLFLL